MANNPTHEQWRLVRQADGFYCIVRDGGKTVATGMTERQACQIVADLIAHDTQLEVIRRLIADDGFACSFQSMAQYRAA